jgi:hypothetical protein
MDYVESIHLKQMRPVLAQFMSNTEDNEAINELDQELPRIVEQVENMRKFKLG